MIEKNLFITQNTYYFVHRYFIKFFEQQNTEVIFVTEKKRGILKKYIEMIENFGIRNFIKIIFYELKFLILLKKRKESLKYFNVYDYKLNQLLENLLKKK